MSESEFNTLRGKIAALEMLLGLAISTSTPPNKFLAALIADFSKRPPNSSETSDFAKGFDATILSTHKTVQKFKKDAD